MHVLGSTSNSEMWVDMPNAGYVLILQKNPTGILLLFTRARGLTKKVWLNQSPKINTREKILILRNLINSLSHVYIYLFLPLVYDYDGHSSNGYFYVLGNKILKSLSKEMNWKAYAASWIIIWLLCSRFINGLHCTAQQLGVPVNDSMCACLL